MVREALFSDSGDGLLEEGHTYKGQISIRIKCHHIDAKEDNKNNFANIIILFFSSFSVKGGDRCRHDMTHLQRTNQHKNQVPGMLYFLLL